MQGDEVGEEKEEKAGEREEKKEKELGQEEAE